MSLDRVRLSRFSAVDDGMHAEVSPEPGSAAAEQMKDPLLSFRAAEEGSIQVLIHLPTHDIALPLSELKRAIEFAEAEVHSESYYPVPPEEPEASTEQVVHADDCGVA